MTGAWKWLLSSLWIVFGFTACEEEYEASMYGSPHATFVIKGKVENSAKQGLPRVQIVIPLYEVRDTVEGVPVKKEYGDTLYTDQRGQFFWERVDYPGGKDFELRFYDIYPREGCDACQADTLKVSFSRDELIKGEDDDNSWYSGRADKNITVVLEEKRDE